MKRLGAVCLVILLSYGLILKQVYPTLTTGDAAEFIVNAGTLGINHPAGYPLYSLLGKCFSLLPLGAVAFRINLLSAVATAVSASMLVLTLSLIGPLVLSLLGGLLLPLGLVTLNQSLGAETYTLNLFFFSLLLYFAGLFLLTSRRKYVLILVFCWGLGLANHYLALFAIPLVLFVLISGYKNSRRVVFSIIVLGLGLAVYWYLPLRAVHSPPINWGTPSSLTHFAAHLKRSEYHQLEFGRSVSFKDKIMYIGHFVKLSLFEFSPLGFLMSGLGLVVLLRRRFLWGGVLLLEYLLYSLGLIFILHFPYRLQDTYRVAVYYLPAFYLSLIFLFFGSFWLWRKLDTVRYLRNLFLILFALPLVQYWQLPPKRLNFLTYDYLHSLVTTMPQKCQLVTEGDNETFGLFYLKFVTETRPDIDIFNVFEKALRTTRHLDQGKPRAYANQKNAPRDYRPSGLLFMAESYLNDPWRYYRERGFKQDYHRKENFERELMATFTLFKGSNYLFLNDRNRAIPVFEEAVQVGEEFAWVNNNVGAQFARMGQFEKAAGLYRRAIAVDPYYLEAYFNLGLLLEKQNDPSYREVLKKYLELSRGLEKENIFRRQIQRLLTR